MKNKIQKIISNLTTKTKNTLRPVIIDLQRLWTYIYEVITLQIIVRNVKKYFTLIYSKFFTVKTLLFAFIMIALALHVRIEHSKYYDDCEKFFYMTDTEKRHSSIANKCNDLYLQKRKEHKVEQFLKDDPLYQYHQNKTAK